MRLADIRADAQREPGRFTLLVGIFFGVASQSDEQHITRKAMLRKDRSIDYSANKQTLGDKT